MNNFDFYNPVKILFGKGQIANIASNITGKNVLFLYGGGSIKKNGVYEQVICALTDCNVTEFGGIRPNPEYDKAMEAVTVAKDNHIDFILAVGGGSVIDAAKFISVAIHHDQDPWKILAERQAIQGVTPMGCILTLPATGSEMNSFSVISRGKDKLGFGGDPRLYPKFSVLDPETTYSLPQRQLGNGIVDAFVHTTEQYLTTNLNTLVQDQFAESILRTLIEVAPKIMSVEKDYNARANFMWAATNALNGMLGVGVTHDWATHMIGHELTGLHGIDHARSLAVVLPSLLRHTKETKKEKLLQFAQRVWNITEGTEDERIEKSIQKTEIFFQSVEVPTTLAAYNLKEDSIDPITESLLRHIPTPLGEAQNIDKAAVASILKQALV